MPAPPSAIFFYDNRCGLCTGGVGWLARRDRGRQLAFAPLNGLTAVTCLAAHPYLATMDTAILVTAPGTPDQRLHLRSSAAIRALALTGSLWRLALLALIVPARWRDPLYDLVARRRHRLARPAVCSTADTSSACFLP